MRVVRGVICGLSAWVALGLAPTPARAQVHCTATFRLDDAVALGALQIDVDYAPATTAFDGSGSSVSCTGLVPALANFQDDDAGTLTMAFVSFGSTFSGPTSVAACDITATAPIQESDLGLTVTAATDSNSDPVAAPGVSVSLFCDGDTTTTVSTSTTTTTFPTNEVCTVRVELMDAVTLGSLQVEIDYSRAHGEFQDSGAAVDCVTLAPGAFAMYFDDDVESLGGALVKLSGLVGPTPVFQCIFLPKNHTPDPGDFVLSILDASDPNATVISPQPSIIVSSVDCFIPTTTTSTTTTTLPPCGNSHLDAGEECDDGNTDGGDGCDAFCMNEGLCGDADLNTRITAGDAQLILQAAVGLPATCPMGVCDTNADGGLTVGDAQRTLVSAVGLPALLNCP